MSRLVKYEIYIWKIPIIAPRAAGGGLSSTCLDFLDFDFVFLGSTSYYKKYYWIWLYIQLYEIFGKVFADVAGLMLNIFLEDNSFKKTLIQI